MQITTSLESKITQFFDLMTAGKEAWVKAGRLLAEMVDENENTYEIIIQRSPNVKVDTLQLLERIGRKPFIAELLLNDCYWAKKVIDLADNDAERAIEHPIPVVTETANGPSVVQKRPEEMTRKEVDLVFSGRQIQPPEKQIEALAEKAKEKAARDKRFWFDGDKIHFRQGAEFTLGDLEGLLERWKAERMATLNGDVKKAQLNGK